MQWKGHLPEGKIYAEPVISLDVVPTALAAAGAPADASAKLDGVDLLPYLSGKNSGRPHDTLYWRFGPQWAIRSGDFKLLQPPEGGVQLYDLAADVSETKDLSADKPEVVERLTKQYAAWNSQLAEPRWKANRRGAGKAKAAGKGKAAKKKQQQPAT